jgi:hypothetical protein
MKDGLIVQSGTYQQLTQQGQEFSNLLMNNLKHDTNINNNNNNSNLAELVDQAVEKVIKS